MLSSPPTTGRVLHSLDCPKQLLIRLIIESVRHNLHIDQHRGGQSNFAHAHDFVVSGLRWFSAKFGISEAAIKAEATGERELLRDRLSFYRGFRMAIGVGFHAHL